MTELAIIGGTGLTELEGLEITHRQMLTTPYGEISSPIVYGTYADQSVIFLARHGARHTIPPHKINYRANIWGLKELGVNTVIACAAVGGIHPEFLAGDIVIPHQLIDYTSNRANTFFENELTQVTHIDFTHPYCDSLRQQLLATQKQLPCRLHSFGVYAATQGPRLETAAEIDKMARDGCDIVGMTGMPEAALARELGLCYATCAIVANPAAGRGAGEISMAHIETTLTQGMQHVRQVLAAVISVL
ncbi:MAG: S-methyl-5'-thioinosine phosphorylase [Pseudomonadota bacterium]|nr:S-methyl-5'-thioinosine phosphorylase [Pseudomonadota bacterium]